MVEVAEEDRENSLHDRLSSSSGGQCLWATNSPAMFQHIMELVLRELPWHVCMVYVNDVLIYSPTFEHHLFSLYEVFFRIREAGLRLNPRKLHLVQDHVVFLGHVVSHHGLQPDL